MSTAGKEEPLDLVPARMLNEYIYCPRLFYLEWVDARWSDNSDTVEGRFAHRRVDKPGQPLPPPGEELELLKAAHSVQLSDTEIGVTAVIDRVDLADGTACPVDIKKGSPTPDDKAWPADEMQMLVQAVLLRRAGYLVESAVVYYVAANKRVTIPVTDGAEDVVRDTAIRALEVASSANPPLPLIDSPKCPRCSLVSLCLPDEINATLERSAMAPRRIVPADPDHRPVYVTEQGSYVGVKGGRLVVRMKREELASTRLIDVSQLNVFGHVQVSTEALMRLWSRGVPVLWFSYGGWLKGWAQGEMSRYVDIRRRQIIARSHGGMGMASAMIAAKIKNCRTLLMRNARPSADADVLASLKNLANSAAAATSRMSLMGYEGTAARLYFGSFTRMLGAESEAFGRAFKANGRNRRPPRDPVNCLLSFCYGLLTKDLVAVGIGVGLDPFVGVLHTQRFGRPSLALDLAEEFRPIIADSVVLQVLNNGEVRESDFLINARGVSLTVAGRKTVISAYERRLETEIKHPVFGYRISYRRVMDVQARLLAAVMLGELPTYTPMMTR